MHTEYRCNRLQLRSKATVLLIHNFVSHAYHLFDNTFNITSIHVLVACSWRARGPQRRHFNGMKWTHYCQTLKRCLRRRRYIKARPKKTNVASARRLTGRRLAYRYVSHLHRRRSNILRGYTRNLSVQLNAHRNSVWSSSALRVINISIALKTIELRHRHIYVQTISYRDTSCRPVIAELVTCISL